MLHLAGNTQGAVWIHQITRRHSQAPFRKVKGSVQLVQFHPSKPHFFVAVCNKLLFRIRHLKLPSPFLENQTQRYVRMYDLAAQQLLKTLLPGLKWISSMDVHPSGDHLIVGGYDRKLCWFDLELSDKPYKVLR
jgi:ribosome biogenesis protein ERB1